MAVLEIAKIQIRRGQELQTGIPQLDPGEFGWAEDTEHLYIGKRITEGAVDDTNTRILTENDLNFFKTIASNTYTVASYYRYRVNDEWIDSMQTTIQNKLDSFNPNLNDFVTADTLAPIPNGTDITEIFNNAVQNIFNNTSHLIDARRQLIIPPGNYVVSGRVLLPPFASIVGSGPGLTTITFISSATNLFQTVDAVGTTFEDPNGMQSGQDASQYVNISNMTLKFSSSLQTEFSLISLDNVKNANVANVEMITDFDQATTTTYGLVANGDYRTGIQIRGQGDVRSNNNLCQNIVIKDCVFNGLYRAIEAIGSVVSPTIEGNLFTNLTQGIEFRSDDNFTIPGPSSGVVKNNRFQNILQQGFRVNSNPNNNAFPTGHISSENYFDRVGNGTYYDDLNPNTGTAVITFLGSQDKSVNDQFNRKIIANTNTSSNFYYNPLIDGNISINDTALYSLTVDPNVTETMTKIPLIKKEQLISILYLMSNNSLSRKGNLLINISAAGRPDVVDNYSFSEGPHPKIKNISPVREQSGYNTFAVNISKYPDISYYRFDNGNNWYLQASSDSFDNYIKIISTSTGTGNVLLLHTDPAEGFNFAPYTLTLTQNAPPNSTKLYVDNVSNVAIGDTVTWAIDQHYATYKVVSKNSDDPKNPYITIDPALPDQLNASDDPTKSDQLSLNQNITTETYSINTDISYSINFAVDNTHAATNNYISVNCKSQGEIIESLQLKYQINILG